MSVLTQHEQAMLFRPTGAFGGYKKWVRGEWTFAEAVANCSYAGIYQSRPRARGRIWVKSVYYKPANPRTVPQQNWRAFFSQGVAQYHLLTPPEKEKYTIRAKRLHMSAFNVYMSEWLAPNGT